MLSTVSTQSPENATKYLKYFNWPTNSDKNLNYKQSVSNQHVSNDCHKLDNSANRLTVSLDEVLSGPNHSQKLRSVGNRPEDRLTCEWIMKCTFNTGETWAKEESTKIQEPPSVRLMTCETGRGRTEAIVTEMFCRGVCSSTSTCWVLMCLSMNLPETPTPPVFERPILLL